MAEQEAKTEKYGFTQSAMEHILGNGEDIKKEDLIDINVKGDDPHVSRLIFEQMAATHQAHWHGTVTVPENADVNTKLWATVKMSEPMWHLTRRLLDKYGLPNIAGATNKRLMDEMGEPDLNTGRPTK